MGNLCTGVGIAKCLSACSTYLIYSFSVLFLEHVPRLRSCLEGHVIDSFCPTSTTPSFIFLWQTQQKQLSLTNNN
jgi:hypothetical protein